MEFELHIRGSIEEISQITTLIEKKLERDKSMFDCLKPTVTTSVMGSGMPMPVKKKKTG
jgi:hypothetical protein